MIKPRYITYVSVVIFVFILIFGFTHRPEYKENVNWSDRLLEWKDFPEVDYIEDDFDAYVYSEIYCPKSITKSNSMVYAYMNPNLSGRLKDSIFDTQLLIHEQYHFNITEYYARLLREAIVEKGKGRLTKSEIRSLHNKYEREKESMQEKYDRISDHNKDLQKQRYWELKIDDLLRKTAYYQNPDIYSYYDFTNGETQFYKHIYYTFEHKILTSYPISADNIKFGESYEVIRKDNYVIVRFYKNGKLFNGGRFKTAITKIIDGDDGTIEMYYFNPDMTYNNSLPYYILKSIMNETKDKVIHYLNDKGKRVTNEKIYEIQWKYQPDGSMYASYFDQNKKPIDNEDGVHHERRSFDEIGRTVKIESFGANNKPMLDKNYVATNDIVFDNESKIIQYKSFGKNGELAFYLIDYYLEYIYDERGNMTKSFNLDQNGDKTDNKKGVCIYEYTYDLYDNTTSISRYNKSEVAVLGTDDYFQLIMDYDTLGRSKFDAYYHPGYILKFDDNKNGAIKYEYLNDSLVLEYNIDAFHQVFNNDFGVAITRKHLNNKKQVIKEEYLDYKKNYANVKNGAIDYRNKYDRAGNMIEQTSLDSLGNVIPFESDVATVRWEYDERNNKIKTTYFNKYDKLARANQNVTFNVYKYNDKNQLIQRMNYDRNMKPELLNGTYKTKFHYNLIGKDSLIKEYNKNNKLINGACITKYEYDKYGNDFRDIYFDTNNRQVKNSKGVSTIRYNYDNKRRYIGYSYLDEFEQPVVSSDGYHKKELLLNDIGEIIKISTYGKDAMLVEDDEGIAVYEYTVETSGLTSKVRYYNKNHQLVEDDEGVAQTFYSPSLNGLYYLDKQLNANGEEVKEKEEL